MMQELTVEIDEPKEGYAVYRVKNAKGEVVFKSSAPAFLVFEIAATKRKQLARGE